MIVHSTSSSRGPSDPTAPCDGFDRSDRDADAPSDADPFRQLFHRHANHMNSAHTHRLQARLRRRLFAEDSEA